MRARRLLFTAVLCAAVATGVHAAPQSVQPKRRALLIGIDDYSASNIARASREPVPNRDWNDLSGAVNDVQTMRELLQLLYGFQDGDIRVLTNQQATREAILQALETHLVASAAKDTILLFYYAGHGSQVQNSKSSEPDKKDESIVPADSRHGAKDILDKDLRKVFNRIVDRGARLTVILDSCHSGSGARDRGLRTGRPSRSVKIDRRDVADASDAGPRPEDRGALIISAAQDFDVAWETKDEQSGRMHGAFSWAWARAVRDASPDEPVADTFLRARARLRAETPAQEPVLAGNDDMRLRPFLRLQRQAPRRTVAIESIGDDGTIVLQGGWADGLTVGSELRISGSRGEDDVRIEITRMKGLGRSQARLKSTSSAKRSAASLLRSGALLEVAGWVAPPGPPLRVWIPRTSSLQQEIAFARDLAARAAKKNVRWVADPIETIPSHLIRWRPDAWELIAEDEEVVRVRTAAEAIDRIRAGASLFVQLPASTAIVAAMSISSGSEWAGLQFVNEPAEADYHLVGRYRSTGVEYAWQRPEVSGADRQRSALPLSSAWEAQKSNADTGAALLDAIRRLRRVHGWHHLESHPDSQSPYRLVIRRSRDGAEIQNGTLTPSDYGFLLRARTALPAQVPQRYVYVFMVDSEGAGVLLFPPSGSVENHFPLKGAQPPAEIPLGDTALFEVKPPYGIDTYFLLTTDEPLPNPWVLDWDGVRGTRARPKSPLEKLLAETGSTRSSGRLAIPPNWSIERTVVVSVPPQTAVAR